jgi:phytoene dehydrogenase-like protein
MSTQSREVLVIGAGIAGLTAARDLAVDGYDVAILEARERTGGRIWTSHELGLPADLGASWIHGFEDNPIARLARRHAIAIVRTNISSVTPARYRSMVLYDEDGRRLSSRETAEMSEMMADYLDFVAAKQKEGQETSMLAVEATFAASHETLVVLEEGDVGAGARPFVLEIGSGDERQAAEVISVVALRSVIWA